MNPLYLRITHANGYIEEINENKYLIFDSIDENKELLKKYNDVFNGIRNKIKKISGDECDYEKDYMKIKFNSDDELPLNKPLKFHLMTIAIRSVFEEDCKLYPQVVLDDTLYELNVSVWKTLVTKRRIKMLEYNRIDISERIDVNKTNLLKECDIRHYWYFKDIGFKYEPYLWNGCHDLKQKAMSFNNVAIVYVKGHAYRIHVWYINKDDAINIMNGSNFVDKSGVL